MRHPQWPWKAAMSMLLVLMLSGVIWWWAERKEPFAQEAIPIAQQKEPVERTAQEESTEKAQPNETPSDANMPQRQEATTVSQESVLKKSEEYGDDMLTRDQKRLLPLFVSVTDSILGELRLLVANEQAPYQLGGLEAYTAAYERLKAAAMECGKHGCDVPFWMHHYWMTYNGRPKPYDLFDNYLFQQLSSIEALYQTHANNYALHQKQTNDNLPPP